MNQKGQIFPLALIVLTLVLVNTVLIIAHALLYSQHSLFSLDDASASQLAEAGIDKAVASLNSTAGSYNGEQGTIFGPGAFDVTVTSKDSSTDIITSTGYVPNKAHPKATKVVKIQVSKGTGISFVYGILTGTGGITMGNGSTINGSVYSNGNITGGNNETTTGDIFVAGGTQPTADQQSDCSGTACSDFIFGTTVNSNSQLDVAQSFKPSLTAGINKVSLKLKTFGSPANLTVRLLTDNDGNPDKNNVLASGTLAASLVSSSYNFVDVTFTSTPTLTANTRYWIMLAASSDSNNYWYWSKDTSSGYFLGSSKWSSDWQAKTPVWQSINGDLGFKTWMGGAPTQISMNNGSVIQGNVHSNTINGMTINKNAYYQLISSSVIKGTSYPNSTDPAPIAMPISDANISDWQNQTNQYGTSTGDITGCPSTMGPGEIIGNVTISNNCTVTVTTPVWITGNLTTGNSDIFQMNPSLGSFSGMIIVNGTTTFSNSDNLLGTGTTGSYLMLLSTYNSQTNQIVAINTINSSITGILYAPYGIISLANNANFKEAVAWQINMGSNTTLTYDSGLISSFFSTGPSGSFSVIKNTYQNL